eukprot:SAG31_NODE_3497_length_4195_cov_5.065430_6_plen_68_part_00
MDHLERERDYFAQFVGERAVTKSSVQDWQLKCVFPPFTVTEDETFDEYVQRKRKDKCFGNHIELQVC